MPSSATSFSHQKAHAICGARKVPPQAAQATFTFTLTTKQQKRDYTALSRSLTAFSVFSSRCRKDVLPSEQYLKRSYRQSRQFIVWCKHYFLVAPSFLITVSLSSQSSKYPLLFDHLFASTLTLIAHHNYGSKVLSTLAVLYYSAMSTAVIIIRQKL